MTYRKPAIAQVAALSAFATVLAMAGSAMPALAAGESASADTVLGLWRTPNKHGEVEIAKCGSSICGRLVQSDGIRANPDLRDVNNKDESKRARMIKGLQILGGGFEAKDGKWTGGTIYNPEDGGTYKATITPDGANRLKLKGCIVWPLCKTQTWIRIR